jgi:hypothetical protein
MSMLNALRSRRPRARRQHVEGWSAGVSEYCAVARLDPPCQIGTLSGQRAGVSGRYPGLPFPLAVNVRAVPGPATEGLVRGVISRVGLVRLRNLREHR